MALNWGKSRGGCSLSVQLTGNVAWSGDRRVVQPLRLACIKEGRRASNCSGYRLDDFIFLFGAKRRGGQVVVDARGNSSRSFNIPIPILHNRRIRRDRKDDMTSANGPSEAVNTSASSGPRDPHEFARTLVEQFTALARIWGQESRPAVHVLDGQFPPWGILQGAAGRLRAVQGRRVLARRPPEAKRPQCHALSPGLHHAHEGSRSGGAAEPRI